MRPDSPGMTSCYRCGAKDRPMFPVRSHGVSYCECCYLEALRLDPYGAPELTGAGA